MVKTGGHRPPYKLITGTDYFFIEGTNHLCYPSDMRTWFKIWAAPLLLLLVYGCVSTGVREINDPTLTARIEAGKSTQAEVTALLGFPTRVTYGQKGQETWEYYYLTEYPHLPQFIPVVDAFVPGLYQCTRVLTLSFDRQGVVQNLQPGQTTGLAEVWPY